MDWPGQTASLISPSSLLLLLLCRLRATSGRSSWALPRRLLVTWHGLFLLLLHHRGQSFTKLGILLFKFRDTLGQHLGLVPSAPSCAKCISSEKKLRRHVRKPPATHEVSVLCATVNACGRYVRLWCATWNVRRCQSRPSVARATAKPPIDCNFSLEISTPDNFSLEISIPDNFSLEISISEYKSLLLSIFLYKSLLLSIFL